MWCSLFRYICYSIRHTILDYAYPVPDSIRVYPGPAGSLYHSIVSKIVEECSLPQLEVVDCPARSRPAIWIDDDATPATGWETVCRYIGRQWRVLPTNPHTCATVDSFVELLQSFVYPFVAETFTSHIEMGDHAATFATILEDSFAECGNKHLGAFNSNTVADLCWAAAWKHVMEIEGVTLATVDYPCLHEWMTHQGVVADELCVVNGTNETSDDETDDSSDDDDDFKKNQ